MPATATVPATPMSTKTKTQEHAAVEKPHSKPGRKALTSEPKNKRTAQNRAAQRAFRERKERRMKELEEKVVALENEKLQIANETELLRVQVRALMKQLGATGQDVSGNAGAISLNETMMGLLDDQTKQSLIDYNNRVMINDINASAISKGKSTGMSDNASATSSSAHETNASTTTTSSTSSSNNTPGSNPSSTSYFSDEVPQLTSQKFAFSMIKDGDNTNDVLREKLNNTAFKDEYDESHFCQQLSQVCGSKECPIPKVRLPQTGVTEVPDSTATNLLLETVNRNSSIVSQSTNVSPQTGDKQSGVSAASIYNKSPFTSSLYDGSLTSGSPGFLGDFQQFDTGLSPAVQGKTDAFSGFNFDWDTQAASGVETTEKKATDTTTNEVDYLFSDENKVRDETNKLIESKPEAFQLAPDAALFTDPLGFDLDYDFEKDDAFEDLLNFPDVSASQSQTQMPIKTEIDPVNDPAAEDNEQVPDTTGNLMQCSQIWERITTHPRFTELDIDNLCDELKQKAKCSESGVVVSGNEVGDLLQKAVNEKQRKQQLQQQRELDAKRLAMNATANMHNATLFHDMWS